jgi:hypothetical protein
MRKEDLFAYKLPNFDEIECIVECKLVDNAIIKLMKEFHRVNGPLDYEKFKSQIKIPNKEIFVPKSDH